MKPAKEFLGHLHAFRALAIFFIVAGHVLDAFVWSTHPVTGDAIRIFFSNGSSLFVFIAGYLFQHLSARFQVQEYWRSKLRNVVAPYLLVSVPALVAGGAVLWRRPGVPEAVYAWPVWERTVYFILTGAHLAPLWFIPMIVIFYAAAPLLVAADRRPWAYVVWPGLLLLTLCIGRGLPPQSFVHFLSFYVAGMLCSHFRQTLDPWMSRTGVWVSALGVALGLGLLQLDVLPVDSVARHGLPWGLTPFGVNALQKLALCLAFLGALQQAGKRTDRRWIGELADLSFGIFFIHAYILSGAKAGYSHTAGSLPEGHVLWWALLTVGVLWACMRLLRVVKRLTGVHSRWLVGC